MRITIGKLFAATLLTLCVGLQLLEATGRWDHAIQDSGDEAVIVAVALCIGAAVGVAATMLQRLRLRPTATRISVVRPSSPCPSPRSFLVSAVRAGPSPLSLRI